MPTCFVIQPFDAGKYDKRFEDVYEPAIRAAGVEPYRVDRDPGVDVPIDAIEDGIRGAAVCLADITTDNPNVWYELGYAFASGRPVVMVCSEERTSKKYPFDIQHRTIIPYQVDAPRDFDALKSEITKRITALMTRTEAFRAIQDTEQVAPVHGLTQPELAVLATIAGSVVVPGEGVSTYAAKREVENAGFTTVGFSIGLHRLLSKGMIELVSAQDDHGNDYQAIAITTPGWDWIERNEDMFMLRRPLPGASPEIDDVPF